MDISWAMNQDAVYRKLIDHDGWGRPTFGPEIAVKVRWQYTQKLVRAANGEEVMCNGKVLTPLTIKPRAKDLFIYDGQNYEVVDPGDPVSVYGEPSHHKVFCRSVVI